MIVGLELVLLLLTMKIYYYLALSITTLTEMYFGYGKYLEVYGRYRTAVLHQLNY